MPKIIPGYSEAARNRITQVALKVFSQEGYSEATMDNIARELGVTKGALYHHFKSKEDILKEIYRWRHQLTQDVLRKSLDDPDPIRGLHELYDTMVKDYQEFAPIEFEILSLAAHDEKIRGIISKGYEEDLEILEKFLQTLVKKGKIRSDANTRMLAASLYAFSLGVAVTTSLGPSIFADRKARRKLMALLLGTR